MVEQLDAMSHLNRPGEQGQIMPSHTNIRSVAAATEEGRMRRGAPGTVIAATDQARKCHVVLHLATELPGNCYITSAIKLCACSATNNLSLRKLFGY